MKNYATEFNTFVSDVKNICREARHMDISNKVANELPNFCTFLDDVNVKMKLESNPNEYVRLKMLDALDYLKDNLVDFYKKYPYPEDCVTSVRVVNFLYDFVKDFYFNN